MKTRKRLKAQVVLVMDKIARSFYRDQQARADAAPAVADDNFGWDPFRPASEHGSEMECA